MTKLYATRYKAKELDQLMDRVMFLTIAGSHAYGLETPDSDFDIRGIMLPRESDIFGLTEDKTFSDSQTDTVIYPFVHFMKMLMKGSPNAVELLFTPRTEYLHVTAYGELLLVHKELFITQQFIQACRSCALSYVDKLNKVEGKDKKAAAKAMSHIMRLYCMIEDALKHGEIRLASSENHDLLMSIKLMDDKWFKDGFASPDFWTLLSEKYDLTKALMQHTILPKTADFDKVNDLTMDILQKALL